MRSAMIPAFVYTCIAVLATWPAIRDLGAFVPGAEGTNVWETYWVLQHVLQSVVDGQSIFVTQDLNYPFGGRIVAPDVFGALLVLPLTYFWGPAVSMTLLVVFQVAFSGVVLHLFTADFLKRGPWLSSWPRGGAETG